SPQPAHPTSQCAADVSGADDADSHAPLLSIDECHHSFVVPGPGHRIRSERTVERLDVLRIQRQGSGQDVLFEVAAPLGARNRDDVAAPGEQPGQRHLAGGRSLPLGDLLNYSRGPHVGLEVLALKAGIAPAIVAFGVVLGAPGSTRQEPAPERAERHETDAELPEQGEDPALQVPLPETVLALECGYGMNC